ncbi:MAG: hypothetical protein WCL08_04535, partial [Verrucomicrobiota bacterium]
MSGAKLRPSRRDPDGHLAETRALVGVGAGLRAQSLLRAARDFVSERGGQLFAVSVETPELQSLSERKMRAENLVLARQLGAEVILATGSHVGRTILRVAHEHKISLLVLGKPEPLSKLRFWGDASPVEWLQRNSGSLGILLISTVETELGATGPVLGNIPEASRSVFWGYVGAFSVACVATLVG